MINTKEYIADGVYAEIVEGLLCLTTKDGIITTNSILFEPKTLDALLSYLRKHGWLNI